MTAPDIIEIAKKAAAEVREDADGLAYVGFYPRSFDRFAALYREALIASGEVVEPVATPITNAAIHGADMKRISDPYFIRLTNTARQLERELTAERARSQP